jgi:hypothetical protein
MATTSVCPPLRYKSVAGALLFSVILGPVGLLYASFWGGLFMIAISIVVISGKFFFVTLLVWLICCIWSVGSAEAHNKKLASSAASLG